MANNKVVLADGTVLLDLTSDTVSAETLANGQTAHDMAGNQILGTAQLSDGNEVKYTAQSKTDSEKQQARTNIGLGNVDDVSVNRSTNVNAADTNYTTLMVRGEKLLDANTFDAVSNWGSQLVNGAIAWRYE